MSVGCQGKANLPAQARQQARKSVCSECGKEWNTSPYSQREPYVCPHCESRLGKGAGKHGSRTA